MLLFSFISRCGEYRPGLIHGAVNSSLVGLACAKMPANISEIWRSCRRRRRRGSGLILLIKWIRTFDLVHLKTIQIDDLEWMKKSIMAKKVISIPIHKHNFWRSMLSSRLKPSGTAYDAARALAGEALVACLHGNDHLGPRPCLSKSTKNIQLFSNSALMYLWRFTSLQVSVFYKKQARFAPNNLQ